MILIYESTFGIGKDELKDEHFPNRLRRSGLKDSKLQQNSTVRREDESFIKEKKKGAKSI